MSARSLSTLGLGFGALAIASIGFVAAVPEVVVPPYVAPPSSSAGGGAAPGHGKGKNLYGTPIRRGREYTSPEQADRIQQADEEAELTAFMYAFLTMRNRV